MPAITEREVYWGVERTLLTNQKSEERSPKLIAVIKLKLISKRRVGRSVMGRSFCSLCNQMLIFPPTVFHVSFRNHFLKTLRLLKILFFL